MSTLPTEPDNPMTRYLARIPGVTTVTRTKARVGYSYTVVREDEAQCTVRRYVYSDSWEVDMSGCPNSTWGLTGRQTVALLQTWATPARSHAHHARRLGTFLSEMPACLPGITQAQETYARARAAGSGFVPPDRLDGRFTVAGITEPYPGCWPDAAVVDAWGGDLSTLWPYLDGADDEPEVLDE